MAITSPVNTRTNKGKHIKHHYYFYIKQAVESPHLLDEAVIAVDENRQLRANFGRDIVLDLSSLEKECKTLYFPCDQIMNSDSWEETLYEIAPENMKIFMDFRKEILNSFRNYQIPVIELKKETSKEAVCLVFEKVNTGGVSLSVFELITASYAADGYNLRDDWFGSKSRNVGSRKERMEKDSLLQGIEAPEFLQAVTLLYTHELRKKDIKADKTGKQVKPVSAKRVDILELPLDAWNNWAHDVEKGFMLAAKFLKKEAFYARRELPYSTQLVPLAAVLARLEDRWLEPRIYEKLARWYWSGVLGELYGGAVETRMANDYAELLKWFEDSELLPRTLKDASFQAERFDTFRTRNSAAYKGINVLVLREGAKDWFWKASIQELDANEIALDIHHIFPQDWCIKQGIKREDYDCILNKTPISYKANRKIGGVAPSIYLPKIQNEEQVQFTSEEMDELLKSHALSPELLRNDAFEAFIEDRLHRLLNLIEIAMGKIISKAEE